MMNLQNKSYEEDLTQKMTCQPPNHQLNNESTSEKIQIQFLEKEILILATDFDISYLSGIAVVSSLLHS